MHLSVWNLVSLKHPCLQFYTICLSSVHSELSELCGVIIDELCLQQVNSFFDTITLLCQHLYLPDALTLDFLALLWCKCKFIKSNWVRRGQHVCGKTAFGCHSSCDMALSLLSHFLIAFCFLLPLFYACTHPFTASLCGQFDGISWAQVSSTPATGPGSSLCVDCLCLSFSISLNSSARANKAVSLFFI